MINLKFVLQAVATFNLSFLQKHPLLHLIHWTHFCKRNCVSHLPSASFKTFKNHLFYQCLAHNHDRIPQQAAAVPTSYPSNDGANRLRVFLIASVQKQKLFLSLNSLVTTTAIPQVTGTFPAYQPQLLQFLSPSSRHWRWQFSCRRQWRRTRRRCPSCSPIRFSSTNVSSLGTPWRKSDSGNWEWRTDTRDTSSRENIQTSLKVSDLEEDTVFATRIKLYKYPSNVLSF